MCLNVWRHCVFSLRSETKLCEVISFSFLLHRIITFVFKNFSIACWSPLCFRLLRTGYFLLLLLLCYVDSDYFPIVSVIMGWWARTPSSTMDHFPAQFELMRNCVVGGAAVERFSFGKECAAYSLKTASWNNILKLSHSTGITFSGIAVFPSRFSTILRY